MKAGMPPAWVQQASQGKGTRRDPEPRGSAVRGRDLAGWPHGPARGHLAVTLH